MTVAQPPPIDNRTYRELLAEVTARIAVHNPEWRNHNDSDPGMTLLQLWAFMSENLLYQTGLVPERVRAKFLELLGIEAPPATAASGIVAFHFPKGRLELTTIPQDREVFAGRVPFRTITGLTAAPVEVRAYVKRRVPVDAGVEDQYRLLYGPLSQPGEVLDYYVAEPVSWTANGSGPLELSVTVDGALWLAVLARRPTEVEGARTVLGGQVLSLGVVPDVTLDRLTMPPGGSIAATSTEALEFHLPDTSLPLAQSQDGRVPTYRPVATRTDAQVLVEPGVVELMLPAAERLTVWDDLEPTESGVGRFPPSLEGDDAARLVTWIRVRPAGGPAADLAGRRPVRLAWVGVNAALVEQRARVVREQVGVGTGLPDQRLRLANAPVLLDTVELSVGGEPWQLVDDLMQGGPEVPTAPTNGAPLADPVLPTRIVKVTRANGEVLFGDGLHGARPPKGAPIVARYDVGGGRHGLVGAGSIAKATFLPAGAAVSNPLPTWGGGEAPTQAEAERTIAAFVRHRDRMVAPADFVDVVRSAPGIELGRVEVLPLVHPDLPGQQLPGVVTLLLLPRQDPLSPDAPAPDQSFLRAVCHYVQDRRLLTTELHLRGPVYEPVWVSVGIDLVAGRATGPVREDVKGAVRAFLSPLTGGHQGTGWPLLTPVSRLELAAVVARVDGVAKVFDVLVAGTGGTPVDQVPMPTTLHLPRLVGLEVRQGDPLPMADLQGAADASPALLPVPVIGSECC
jgi:predicted phage baseplate assembly protein